MAVLLRAVTVLAVSLTACGDDPIDHLPDGPAPTGCQGTVGSFDDDFSAGLRPELWTVTQTTAGELTVTTASGSVHLAKVQPSPGGFQGISVALDLSSIGGPISGDFTLAVDFANAMIGPAEDQVELHPQFVDQAVFFDVYSDHGGSPELHVWDGAAVHPGFTTAATGGTLQIARAGAMLTATAIVDATERPVYAAMGTASPLTAASLNLQLQPGSDDAVAVDFRNFHLRWTCAAP